MLESQDFRQLFVVVLEELEGAESLMRGMSSATESPRCSMATRGHGIHLLVRTVQSCSCKLASSQIMFLAGGDRVGLAGLKDRIPRVRVGLEDQVRH